MADILTEIKTRYPEFTDDDIFNGVSEAKQKGMTDEQIIQAVAAAKAAGITPEKAQALVAMPTQQDTDRYSQVRDYVAKARGIPQDVGQGAGAMFAKGLAGLADARMVGSGGKSEFLNTQLEEERAKRTELNAGAEAELGRLAARERLANALNIATGKQEAKATENDPNGPEAKALRLQLQGLDPDGSKEGAYEAVGPKGLARVISAITGKERAASLTSRAETAEKGQTFREEEQVKTRKADVVKQFNNDPNVRKMVQSKGGAEQVKQLALSGNPIAAAAIPTFMARASGEVGNLSEADKAPFGGSASILRRLEAALTQKAAGQLTEANKQFLIQLAQVMDKAADRNLDRIAQDRSGQYSKTYNFSSEELYGIMRPGRPAVGAEEAAAGGGAGEIKRRTKDGKIAIFDSETKKFLRWGE